MNLYEGEVARRMGCAVYGIRPEHVRIDRDDGLWTGRVRHVERLGADTIVHLEVPELGPLLARIEGNRAATPGETLRATPDPAREVRF